MRSFTITVFFCSLVFIGCGTMAQLEEENIQLQSELDSLKVLNRDYSTQIISLSERVSALEKENLVLDDRARQLSARLAEVSVVPTTLVPVTTDARIAPGEVRSIPQEKTQPEIPTPPSVSQSPVHATVSTASADDAFLRSYQNALNDFNARKFQEALQQFESLRTTSPANDMTDNCEYWSGECFFALERYPEAQQRFSTVIEMRGSDKADDALMMRGNTHLKMNNRKEAKKDFTQLTKQFPSSELASRAKQKLRTLK